MDPLLQTLTLDTLTSEDILCLSCWKDRLGFFTRLSPAHREHVTRLALERFTNPFQGIESNSLCLVLLQAPESRMTYSGFFGQPIEGPLMLLQQLVYSNSNHFRSPTSRKVCPLFITAGKYLSIEYIAFLTYIPACYSLVLQIESSQLSPQFHWIVQIS